MKSEGTKTMAKGLIYENTYEDYQIDDTVFNFYKSPFYKKSEHNYKEKEVKNLIEKIKNEDIDETILHTYLFEIRDNTLKVISKPKLYKIRIGNKVFADVFYDFKILITSLNETDTVITVYFNYHSFQGNETTLNDFFYVENCYQETDSYSINCNKYLFSPNGDILDEEIELDEISKYIK